METLLQQARAKDRVLQYTSVGLHKDDLVFTLNGRPLKKVGSQGQQKSYLVAVKLAQFARLTAALGRKPLLLLDDVFDKLDAQRVEALVSLVRANEFGQIFLTDTHPDRTEALVKRMDETGNVVNL
jgi:DNA replication and repair protein RecF